jgi:ribosomal protein S18 acetylase RimI-like enzyme
MKRAPRAQIFDAAGARVTEPGVFDRDAADAAWIKAVEAAGVAKAERTDKTAAKTVETHGAPATPTTAPPERTRPVTAPPRGAETEIRQTVAEAERATTRSFRDAGKLVEKAAEIYHNGAYASFDARFRLCKNTTSRFWGKAHGRMLIRSATTEDHDAIWQILEPTIRAGETYALPSDMSRADAIAYWTGSDRQTFVADEQGRIIGTYYLRANQGGGGAHVANCGYMTADQAKGRGVARSMCEHSLQYAHEHGFRAMQFNFVISTNERAIRLWQHLGFEIVGRLPLAFLHPKLGYTDALVMFRSLGSRS